MDSSIETETPLNVLVTTSTFPVHLDDGHPRFVFDLSDALATYGAVTVLAPDSPGAARHEELGAVKVRRFSYFFPRSRQMLALRKGMRENLRSSLLTKIQVPFFLFFQYIAIKKLMRGGTYDVLNAHWLLPQGLTAALAQGFQSQIKLVVHLHGGDISLLKHMRFGRNIARFIIKRCDAVFAAGSAVRDELDLLLGFPSGAVLQPMGVRRKQFARHDPPLPLPHECKSFQDGYLLCIGSMVEKKGMVYLLQAMPRVLKEHPQLKLVLIGDGPEEKRLHEEVNNLGIASSVALLGRRSQDEIIGFLHHCRTVIVPSITDRNGETEGMPTVVVEAMAAGVPVIGSRVAGLPDVIQHEENGWLCREKDPEDLAENILLALASDQEQMARAASERADDFDWSQIAAHYMKVIHAS